MVTSLMKAKKELRSAADNIRLNVHSPSGPYIMTFLILVLIVGLLLR